MLLADVDVDTFVVAVDFEDVADPLSVVLPVPDRTTTTPVAVVELPVVVTETRDPDTDVDAWETAVVIETEVVGVTMPLKSL